MLSSLFNNPDKSSDKFKSDIYSRFFLMKVILYTILKCKN